jgi:hypothetical protein
MKSTLFSLIILSLILLYGCKKDNKEPPSSTITGRVTYNKQPVSLRSNGVQLELWQHGYQLFSKIPVYINQDGTFSAKVFNGNYKLTLLNGNGPWKDKTDSIDVAVDGSVQVDVPVNPYFVISNESYQKSGKTITATFNLQNLNAGKALELVRIYIGQTIITDQINNAASDQKTAAAITDLSQPVTLSITVPASLENKDVVFARVGVKASGVSELLYSQPKEISLK